MTQVTPLPSVAQTTLARTRRNYVCAWALVYALRPRAEAYWTILL